MRERPALRLRIGSTPSVWSYGDLAREAAQAAAALVAEGCKPGDTVALLLPHTGRLVALFFGAIWAGCVPSILAWPTARMDPEKYRRNATAVVASLGATQLVTEPSMAEHLGAALDRTQVIRVNALESAALLTAPRVRRDPRAPLFIQFSGGTTGTQKSVPISADKLARQLDAYDQALRLRPDDAIASWLPLYHDMGLIACLMLPFTARLAVSMLAPMEWIMDPWRLLDAVHADRATLCWLPNFAFGFMAQKARVRSEIDLSCLRAVINCSEPVRADSMDAFAARFEEHGFRRSALHTCYAMAEATFAVTQSTAVRPPRRLSVSRAGLGQGRIEHAFDERTLVSCGPLIPGVEIRVVDGEGRDVPPSTIGEIWLRGGFIMDDYLAVPGRSDPPRAAFAEGDWYRTGDLGAMVDGELYVTGRKKDVIIVGGVNAFPEDIEAAVSGVAGIHAGRVVCMGFSDASLGTEQLVVAAEVDDETGLARAAELEREIRGVVLLACGVAPYKIFVVPPKWIVKSTAGKISRTETRDRVRQRWDELSRGASLRRPTDDGDAA